jgi:hypothetical protein
VLPVTASVPNLAEDLFSFQVIEGSVFVLLFYRVFAPRCILPISMLHPFSLEEAMLTGTVAAKKN